MQLSAWDSWWWKDVRKIVGRIIANNIPENILRLFSIISGCENTIKIQIASIVFCADDTLISKLDTDNSLNNLNKSLNLIAVN